jgi:hypothetical protein
MFITESMRMFAASAAFLISSALRSSGSVGACVRRHFEAVRGAQLRGSISYHTPFLRESVGGDAEVLEVAPATRESARAPLPRLAAHAAVTEELKNSRVGGRMGNLNAVYSSRLSNPIPLWISWFHPRSLRVLCKLRCAPSCRRARTRYLSRPGYENSRW